MERMQRFTNLDRAEILEADMNDLQRDAASMLRGPRSRARFSRSGSSASTAAAQLLPHSSARFSTA